MTSRALIGVDGYLQKAESILSASMGDIFGPDRDWMSAMPIYERELQPILGPVGWLGLRDLQWNRENDYIGATKTTPALNDGVLRTVEFWRSVYDHVLKHEEKYGRAITNVERLIRTHNGKRIYDLANLLDGISQGWIATKDPDLLEYMLSSVERNFEVWLPENELASVVYGFANAYGDTYMSIDAMGVVDGARAPGGQAPQDEAQYAKNILYFVCHALQDPGVQGDSVTLGRIENIRSWLEVNIFEKWYLRVNPAQPTVPAWPIVEQPTNLDAAARWASICVLLRQSAGGTSAGLTNPSNWARIEDLSYKLVEDYTNQVGIQRALKKMIIPNQNNPDWFWWPRLFAEGAVLSDGVYTLRTVGFGTGDDVGHSSHLIKYICTAYEFGYDGWTQADIDALATYFKEALWDGDEIHPQSVVYVDGSGAPRVDWLQDGWFDLALHESTNSLALIFQNKRPWGGNYIAQHYGKIMHIASVRGS